MGAGNVKLVYARWGDLPDGPFRLLVYMAVIALDTGEQPQFWGGRDALAVALGRVVASKKTSDPDEIRERELAFKAVNRMVCDLKKAGALTQVSPAAPGRNAVYALNLGMRQQSPLDGDHSEPKRSPLKGDRSRSKKAQKPAADPQNGPQPVDGMVPSNRAEWSPVGGQMVPSERGPDEYEEQVRTELEDQKIGLRTDLAVARAREAEPAPVVEIFPGASQEARYRPPLTRWGRAADAIAEASARRRAAEAAFRAQKEAT